MAVLLKPDLQPRVSEELVEEVHEEVNLETADAQHHMFLRLCPVAAVVASGLLPLHPQEGQLLKLRSGDINHIQQMETGLSSPEYREDPGGSEMDASCIVFPFD